MKKLKLLFLTLLFCSCNNNNFSAQVYDYDTEMPLKNVQIDSNGNKTETDSLGYFSIKVKPNINCQISLAKEGYATKTISRKPDSLGIFTKRNQRSRKIYLLNKESDFSSKRR